MPESEEGHALTHRALPVRLEILNLLALYPDGLHGYRIMKELGVSNGTFYPVVNRLLDIGQLRAADGAMIKWRGQERPQKLYSVTREGLAQVRQARGLLVAPRRRR